MSFQVIIAGQFQHHFLTGLPPGEDEDFTNASMPSLLVRSSNIF
jgi:hypothetical protein